MSVPCLAVPFNRAQSRRRSWVPAVRSSPSDALPTVLGNRSRTLILRVSSYTSMLIFPGPEADPLARKVASSTACDTLHLADVEDYCALGASSSSIGHCTGAAVPLRSSGRADAACGMCSPHRALHRSLASRTRAVGRKLSGPPPPEPSTVASPPRV
ncbi:uncharacterized protein SCHCODRAFT_02643577 [Schizophyllum commune H4-8]|uniref:uncharacterized protein n=1 Tax=Schizophyllum commune (strain H4-8 / FGSC 9210) TaxID=578458 RepID=UPI00215FDB53|nr:uncharacterized protein SCHCODRAFT_02643577 [Schizophyllum commune H4-8]KAI5886232.1 hypothetical protein SCHCODRAFT_02643577 [Schizophyllum commune H4-8]